MRARPTSAGSSLGDTKTHIYDRVGNLVETTLDYGMSSFDELYDSIIEIEQLRAAVRTGLPKQNSRASRRGVNP